MSCIQFYVILSACCQNIGQSEISITVDQSIHQTAKQIKWVDPSLADIILWHGGFHIAKNFIGVIGKRLKSSGFADILEASKVYKPTVIECISFYYINYKNTTTLPN